MSQDTSSETGLLLVPSAIIVPDELRLDVGSVPTGMIPLRGKPILEHIAEAYADYDVARVVAVHEASETIRRYVSQTKYEWEVVEVGETSSLGGTVTSALNDFNTEVLNKRDLFLNFADTLISPVPSSGRRDYLTYQYKDRTYRWTTFEIQNGQLSRIIPKYESLDSGCQPAFTGQFKIIDATTFLNKLQKSVSRGESSHPHFYSALFSYLGDREYDLIEPETWFDVGHLDTYHRTKREFLNSREFNNIEVSDKNVITKRSDDEETLINEIEWYTQIPLDLQPYLPRVYDYSLNPSEPYLNLEYVGYPSLADLQLYGSHGQHIWNSVFYQLFKMLDDFRSHMANTKQSVIKSALEEMYLSKTQRRLDRLRDEERFKPFFLNEEVIVNGQAHPSLSEIIPQLNEVLTEIGLLERPSLSVIHGDLCLPNILYDPRNEILKVIDPRGEFGEFTIYGDPRYDLAKLRHSMVGHYEHLINGQYYVSSSHETAEIEYTVRTTDDQDHRERRFDSVLETNTEIGLNEVKLIEALLFLSMVPLHSDSYERQLCMLGKGLEKVAPYVN